MEKQQIHEDIDVVCIQAPQFPQDVPDTFEKLSTLIPYHAQRRYFGISHPDQSGKILYWAAAEVLQAEHFEHPELKKFIITKGPYAGTFIQQHRKDSRCIGEAFQSLLQHPKLDPQGYCLEVYSTFNDANVTCLVKLLS